MKMVPFWDAALYSLLGTLRQLTGGHCLRHDHRLDDAVGKQLSIVGQYLPDYTTQHPRKERSSGKFLNLMNGRHVLNNLSHWLGEREPKI
jgi:hypothetical protein